jgi:hypothetical protein
VTIIGNPQAAITSGSAGISNVAVSANVVTVDLTGVTNAQTVSLKLSTVNDGVSSGDVLIPMDVLVGDTNADRSVNSSDIGQVKAQTGHTVDGTNFRADLNADGSLDSADVGSVKSRSGTGLP